MKSTITISIICALLQISSFHVISIESRALIESESISDAVVNNIKSHQNNLEEEKPRQSKQDEDASAAAAPTQINTAGIIPPGSAVGQIIQNVIPDAQGAVVSILKAVSSPFDFLSKTVDNYINPTTVAPKPVRRAPIVTSSGGGSNPITVVIVPSQNSAPVAAAAPAPAVASVRVPTSSEGEEEDEENGN